MIRYVDLFCGLGSFTHAFNKCGGFQCVLACDICKAARRTYEANHGTLPLGDIADIDPAQVPPFDVLTAGFPCQPYSVAGRHEGDEDSQGRGTMFDHVMRFVNAHHPRVVILENVPGLLTHNAGVTFNGMLHKLQYAGYVVDYRLLNAADFGVPQARKRLFIFACKPTVDMGALLDFTAYEKRSTMAEFLGREFIKDTARTIRVGGRRSPMGSRHLWDGYWLKDGSEYRLSISDALRLQGLDDNFVLMGTETEKWKLLGNTIPVVLATMIAQQLRRVIGQP